MSCCILVCFVLPCQWICLICVLRVCEFLVKQLAICLGGFVILSSVGNVRQLCCSL